MLNIEHLDIYSTFFLQMLNIFHRVQHFYKCSTFFNKVVDKFEHFSDFGSKLNNYFVINRFRAEESVD